MKGASVSNIIQLVFDGVLILFKAPLIPVQQAKLTVKKQDLAFVKPSWENALSVMANDFLNSLKYFSEVEKDLPDAEDIPP